MPDTQVSALSRSAIDPCRLTPSRQAPAELPETVAQLLHGQRPCSLGAPARRWHRWIEVAMDCRQTAMHQRSMPCPHHDSAKTLCGAMVMLAFNQRMGTDVGPGGGVFGLLRYDGRPHGVDKSVCRETFRSPRVTPAQEWPSRLPAQPRLCPTRQRTPKMKTFPQAPMRTRQSTRSPPLECQEQKK